ncbi:MAG TPA: alpha/beta hydrolase, partial [Chroococcidiopsis sp.]
MNAVLPAIAQPSVERRSRQHSIKTQATNTPVPQSQRWRRALWQCLGGTLGCTIAIAWGSFSPVRAAERVYVTYGIFGSSISLDSLETFAAHGTIERDLAFYTQYASDEQRQQLRDFLTTRASVNHVAVAQFLYTPQGETLLRRAGEIIQTEGRQSGFLALRSALILAAADPEQGLTPLNVIRNFPIAGIRVDVERTLEIARELEQLINQTNIAIATIEQQSALEAATAYTTDFSTLPDLRVRGPYGWNSRSLSFIDRSRPTAPDSLYRSRSFKADLYIPQAKGDRPLPDRFPIIVISHGLGSDRASYAYLAQHLATYGFAVAIPDHPGS